MLVQVVALAGRLEQVQVVALVVDMSVQGPVVVPVVDKQVRELEQVVVVFAADRQVQVQEQVVVFVPAVDR